mgnify:CR=1 FL=1
MRKLAPVFNVLGKMVMLLAVTMLLPLLLADLTDDGAAAAFHWGMGITFVSGLAMTLTTLGFLYISNASRETSALGLLLSSFSQPAKAGSQNGVLPLVLTTWLAGLLVLCSESVLKSPGFQHAEQREWLKMLGLGAAVSFVVAFIFWLWSAASLAALSSQTANSSTKAGVDEVTREAFEAVDNLVPTN